MEDDELGWFGKLLIAAIFVTVVLIPSWACMWRNIQNEPAAIAIGQEATVAPATPNPVFIALMEKARANANSQAVDDEIRLAWNIHLMRRFWAWYILIPVIVVLIGLTLGFVVWYKQLNER